MQAEPGGAASVDSGGVRDPQEKKDDESAAAADELRLARERAEARRAGRGDAQQQQTQLVLELERELQAIKEAQGLGHAMPQQ